MPKWFHQGIPLIRLTLYAQFALLRLCLKKLLCVWIWRSWHALVPPLSCVAGSRQLSPLAPRPIGVGWTRLLAPGWMFSYAHVFRKGHRNSDQGHDYKQTKGLNHGSPWIIIVMWLMVVFRFFFRFFSTFEHLHYTELSFKSFSLCNCSKYNSVQMYAFHLIYLSALPTYSV